MNIRPGSLGHLTTVVKAACPQLVLWSGSQHGDGLEAGFIRYSVNNQLDNQCLLRFSSVFYQKNTTQCCEALQPMKSSTCSHPKTSDTAGTHSSPAVTTRCQGWDPASLHLGWTWAEGGSYPTLLSPARPGWREAKKLQHQMHHKSFEAFFMFLYLSHISKLENPNILVLVYIQPHTPRPSMPIE